MTARKPWTPTPEELAWLDAWAAEQAAMAPPFGPRKAARLRLILQSIPTPERRSAA